MEFNSARERIWVWGKLFGQFLLASGIGQVFGLLSGLIYVRFMPVEQYAFYALCLTTLTFVSLTSDLGLTGSANYFWRASCREGKSFLAYLIQIRWLRLWLFAVSGTIACILLPLISFQADDARAIVVLALMLVLLTNYAVVSFSVSRQVLRLVGAFRTIYSAEIVGQAVRLLTALIMVAGLASSAIVGLAGGAAGAWATLWISQRLQGEAETSLPSGTEPANPRREILRYILPVAPTVGVFAMQDSAILWMAAASGGMRTVAEVFALGRIGAIIGLLTTFIVVVVVPRLSGISDDRSFNLAGWLVRAGLLVLGALMLVFAAFFPQWILWLIGPNYAHLEQELLLVVLIAAISLVTATTALLNRALGWVKLDPYVAALQGGLLLTLLFSWDYSTTWNVLVLSVTVTASMAILNAAVSVTGALHPSYVKI